MDIPKRRYDLTGQHFKRNPFPTFECMREDGPLVSSRMPIFGQVCFAVTHDAASELLKSPDRFAVDVRKTGKRHIVNLLYMPKTIRIMAQSMLTSDDPQHRRLRQFADMAFHARSMDGYRTGIEKTTQRLLNRWQNQGFGDFVDAFARRLPLLVICDILGLPQEDQDEFLTWMAPISEVRSATVVITMIPLMRRIIAYLRKRIAICRAEPDEHLISAMVHAEQDGDRLSEDELVAMIFLLFAAGHETTTHLISGSVLALLHHREAFEMLRADWTQSPAAVEELLRFVSPVQMTKPRFAIADTQIGGVDIPRGQMCIALLASANADPEQFSRPRQLDLRREKNRHLGWGGGPHLCLGMHLARLETQIALEALFSRFPELRLAVSENEIRWTQRAGIRALRTLFLAA